LIHLQSGTQPSYISAEKLMIEDARSKSAFNIFATRPAIDKSPVKRVKMTGQNGI